MATVKRDYYEVLGVPRDATPEQLKAAYRKLAMQYHPDRNNGDKGAEEKFKEVGEAYSILSDPSKKEQFDRFGITDSSQQMQGGDPFGDIPGLVGLIQGQQLAKQDHSFLGRSYKPI